ncbi:ETS-related transcription factor Elf-5 [Lissotriton helveticus]
MLDSCTNNALLPGTALYEPLMTWTEFISSEDSLQVFDHESGGSSAAWTAVPPEHWTRHHVCDWLQFCCDQYKLDSNSIPTSQFDITGAQLCSMSKEEFIDWAGICGECLYFILQNLRTNVIPVCDSPEEESPPFKECDTKEMQCTEDTKTHKGTNRAKSGQPATHLWEFVRDLLLTPGDHRQILEWEDRDIGIFRVVKSEALARMWGLKKKNNKMTYEKLSRALRHYYKTGILERVDRRLVYKFGKNAHGWQDCKIVM